MKMFSRQFPIKCINFHGHTTIIEGPNLFGPKGSFHSPKKMTSFTTMFKVHKRYFWVVLYTSKKIGTIQYTGRIILKEKNYPSILFRKKIGFCNVSTIKQREPTCLEKWDSRRYLRVFFFYTKIEKLQMFFYLCVVWPREFCVRKLWSRSTF